MTSPNDKPWRILKEYANGVMDERGRFYPFTFSNSTLPSKQNVRYYVKNCSANIAASGILAAGYCQVALTRLSQSLAVLLGKTGAQTNAADFFSIGTFKELGILCDVNTPVTPTIATVSGEVNIVYAEVDNE